MGIRRGALTRDIGATGLAGAGWGYITEDFLTEWRGLEKVKRVTEMLYNSPVVGALRMAIEMPIRDIDWQFVDDDDPESERLALANDALANMSYSWNDHIADALLAVFYGWEAMSITYDQVDGRFLWRKFKHLGHDTVQRWLIAEDGGLEGMQQYPHLWPAPIPVERMLLYRLRKTKNNPEGDSILRPAWIPWYYIKNLQQIEAIGLERLGPGLPIIRPPMNADMTEGSTDRTVAERIVRNVRNDEQAGVVLPAPMGEGDHLRWHFELMAANTSLPDYDRVISRYEKRMLMTSLAQFIMLGMDNVGALATHQSASDFFTMAVNAIADMVADTFTKYPLERLMRLNGYDADGIRLEHSPAGDTDLTVIGDFLAKTGAMLTMTPEDEVWLRALMRMPEKDVEELERLREEADQKKRDAAQQMQRQFAQRGGDEERDDNVIAYAADRNPNDETLEPFERQWQEKMTAFLAKQKRRVVKAVREGT
jgi:hypothetical protein